MVLVKHLLGRLRASRHAQVLFLVFVGVMVCLFQSTVLFGWSGAQSHISSGISWGLRIPGTDIWILCFSSCAWRSDASLSSRNKSEVSSPANSCNPKQEEADISWISSWLTVISVTIKCFSCLCWSSIIVHVHVCYTFVWTKWKNIFLWNLRNC